MAKFIKGQTAWNKGKKGTTKPNSGQFKVGNKLWNNENNKKNRFKKGELCPAWKGGITPINKLIRKSYEAKLWRKIVLERDKHKCIWCGATEKLDVDHIKPFAYFPELRFAIDNGRTLCRKCHMTTSTYGNRRNGGFGGNN